jgi:hypothetical protein
MKTSLTEWFQGATSGEEGQEGEQLIDKSQEQQPPSTSDKFKDLDVPEFEELVTLLKNEEGEDLPTKIKTFREKYEASSKIKELEDADRAREKWFRENKIVESREFKEKFEIPVNKSAEIYSALLGETDAEGNYRHEEIYTKLRKAIWNEGAQDMNAPKIKALLKSFSEQYAGRFGVEPSLPTIKEIIDARDNLILAQSRKINAIEKWEEYQEQERISLTARQRELQDTDRKNKTEDAKVKFKDFTTKLNASDYPWAKEEDIQTKAKEFEKDFISMVSGQVNKNTEDYLPEGFKARMYDDLLSAYKELRSFVDEKIGHAPPKPGGSLDGVKSVSASSKSLGDFFGI